MLEVDEIKAVPEVPVSHPFVERLRTITTTNAFTLRLVETHRRRLLANPGRRLRRSMISTVGSGRCLIRGRDEKIFDAERAAMDSNFRGLKRAFKIRSTVLPSKA